MPLIDSFLNAKDVDSILLHSFGTYRRNQIMSRLTRRNVKIYGCSNFNSVASERQNVAGISTCDCGLDYFDIIKDKECIDQLNNS
jgi:hypothetical protein